MALQAKILPHDASAIAGILEATGENVTCETLKPPDKQRQHIDPHMSGQLHLQPGLHMNHMGKQVIHMHRLCPHSSRGWVLHEPLPPEKSPPEGGKGKDPLCWWKHLNCEMPQQMDAKILAGGNFAVQVVDSRAKIRKPVKATKSSEDTNKFLLKPECCFVRDDQDWEPWRNANPPRPTIFSPCMPNEKTKFVSPWQKSDEVVVVRRCESLLQTQRVLSVKQLDSVSIPTVDRTKQHMINLGQKCTFHSSWQKVGLE